MHNYSHLLIYTQMMNNQSLKNVIYKTENDIFENKFSTGKLFDAAIFAIFMFTCCNFEE